MARKKLSVTPNHADFPHDRAFRVERGREGNPFAPFALPLSPTFQACSAFRMDHALALEIARNLLAGWLAGLLIGLERTYNGRSAGFRTHALVGLASAATATLALQPLVATAGGHLGAMPLDPSRLSQGVMTGIGFLGAGVIFKEGISVQGLTTAASIWATAAVGFLFGDGMIYPGVGATALVLITLVVMRWLESAIPWRVYAMAIFRFDAANAPGEEDLGKLLGQFSVSVLEVSYRLLNEGRVFQYELSIVTKRRDAFMELSKHLRTIPGLEEYEVSRISK
jgi:putative Mg2+ transporter-C (MgtC) family protein